MRFDRYLINKITFVDEQQLAVETLPSPCTNSKLVVFLLVRPSRIIFNALTHELHLSVWNRRYALWYMKINMFHNPWDGRNISLSSVLIAAQAANMSATKSAHVNMSARMCTPVLDWTGPFKVFERDSVLLLLLGKITRPVYTSVPEPLSFPAGIPRVSPPSISCCRLAFWSCISTLKLLQILAIVAEAIPI